VNKGEISEIIEYQNPEGVIDPPTQAKPGEMRLEGFSWHQGIRPLKMSDIFRE
jgi:hypothetical protein